MDNNPERWTPAVYAAAQVAKALHQGQRDKGGNDYFAAHLTTVGRAGKNWKEQVVGFLHDAAEDTGYDVPSIIGRVKALLARWRQQPAAMREAVDPTLPPIDNIEMVIPTERAWDEIAAALELLDHHNADSREAYIDKLKDNELARAVKMLDLKNNMDLSRIPHPTAADRARVEKYQREYALLEQAANAAHLSD